MRLSLSALALAIAMSLPGAPVAVAGEAAIHVIEPWARPTIPNRPGAVYMGLHNHQTQDDRLVAVRAEGAGSAELHTVMEHGDVMKMMPVAEIPLEADEAVLLEPGDYHIMLFDLETPLKVGDSLAVTLVFEKAGEIAVSVPVMKNADGGHDHGGHSGHNHGHQSHGHGSGGASN